MRRAHPWMVVAVIAGLLSTRCGEATVDVPYTAPEATGDGLATGEPADYGVQMSSIAPLIERIRSGGYVNIHSLLVLRKNTLVVEEYFPGVSDGGVTVAYDRDTLHTLRSVTKSVNAILIGIAVDQGLIRSVDDPISIYLPEYADIFADPGKRAIRLRHLLSMTAGLQWDEWSVPYSDPRNDVARLNAAPDPVRYVLERPLVAGPGQLFVYSSGVSDTLGLILQRATGLRPDLFAERYLFSMVGITQYYWSRYPNGFVRTNGGLYLRPRDMAKIGLLYLNGGSWGQQRLVSERWVAECTRAQAPEFSTTYVRGYGFQWWLDRFSPPGRSLVIGFGGRGRGGQFVFVVPDTDLVVVFTGWNDNDLERQAYEMMERYVLSGIEPHVRISGE
jgi:CubicO group peptidase (beta-lactamase class C family)